MEWNTKSFSFLDWDSSLPTPSEDFALSSGSELGNAGSSKSSIPVRIGSPSRFGDEGNLLQDTVSTGDEGSKDLPLGLKLRKRTYFEDAAAENDGMAPLAQLSSGTVSDTLVKKTRVSHQSVRNVCCQVEGCTEDLSTAKGYHRKHKVCEAHSKCPLVIVAGQERRFCQQCSRFHALSKFDQKKRSCRRRLSDHNARRRKPQQDIISFSSAALSPSAYADKHHMNFLWSKDPSDSLENSGNSKCDSSYAFKFPQESGLWQKATKVGGSGGTLHLPNSKLYDDFSTHSHEANMLLPLRGITAEVFNQGSESSIVASNLVEAPDLQPALSLLSVGSWVPSERGQTSSLAQPVSLNNPDSAQSMVQVVDSTYIRDFPFPLQSNGDQLKELQLYKAPYGSSQIH